MVEILLFRKGVLGTYSEKPQKQLLHISNMLLQTASFWGKKGKSWKRFRNYEDSVLNLLQVKYKLCTL